MCCILGCLDMGFIFGMGWGINVGERGDGGCNATSFT